MSEGLHTLCADARRWFVEGVRDNYGPLMYAVGFAMGWTGCWAVLH